MTVKLYTHNSISLLSEFETKSLKLAWSQQDLCLCLVGCFIYHKAWPSVSHMYHWDLQVDGPTNPE